MHQYYALGKKTNTLIVEDHPDIYLERVTQPERLDTYNDTAVAKCKSKIIVSHSTTANVFWRLGGKYQRMQKLRGPRYRNVIDPSMDLVCNILMLPRYLRRSHPNGLPMNFTCIVEIEGKTYESLPFLYWDQSPPSHVNVTGERVIREGDSMFLTCHAPSHPKSSYVWSHAGDKISDNKSTTMSYKSAQVSNAEPWKYAVGALIAVVVFVCSAALVILTRKHIRRWLRLRRKMYLLQDGSSVDKRCQGQSKLVRHNPESAYDQAGRESQWNDSVIVMPEMQRPSSEAATITSQFDTMPLHLRNHGELTISRPDATAAHQNLEERLAAVLLNANRDTMACNGNITILREIAV